MLEVGELGYGSVAAEAGEASAALERFLRRVCCRRLDRAEISSGGEGAAGSAHRGVLRLRRGDRRGRSRQASRRRSGTPCPLSFAPAAQIVRLRPRARVPPARAPGPGLDGVAARLSGASGRRWSGSAIHPEVDRQAIPSARGAFLDGASGCGHRGWCNLACANRDPEDAISCGCSRRRASRFSRSTASELRRGLLRARKRRPGSGRRRRISSG